MSLLWIEGVSNVTDGSNDTTINGLKTEQNFGSINTAGSSDPGPSRSQTFSPTIGISSNRINRFFRPTKTIYINCFFRLTDDYNELFDFYGSDFTTKFGLFPINLGGNVFRFDLQRGSTDIAYSDRIFTFNTWYHCELRAFIDNVSGAFELRVNGKPTINVTGVDLVNGGSSEDCMYVQNRSNSFGSFRNLIFYDDSGTINNDWMGPVYVDSLIPKSNGNFNDAINSSGNPSSDNYQYVATRAPVLSSPTNYLSISGSGEKQSYFVDADFEFGSSSVKDIIGFNAMHLASRNGTSNIYIKDFVGYNGTYSSSEELVTTQNTYDYYYSGTQLPTTSGFLLHEINPHTSARWQTSELTGLEFGYEITYTGI